MRFAFVHIKKGITSSKNLGEIKLTKKPLGSVVALIGKNGAGKSRVLEYVSKYLEYLAPESFLDDHILEIPETLKKLAPQIWTNLEKFKTRVSGLTSAQRTMWDPLESTCRHASLSIL